MIRAALTAVALAACLLPAVARGETVVSLTFDDGSADQLAARPALAAHGMRATFYVNSARLGRRRYLGVDDLRSLQAEGHEIGGHTAEHLRLTALDDVDQRRQVCGDRLSLVHDGLDVVSFAYPFSADSPATEGVVAACGYSSARTSSGLAGPGHCLMCPVAGPLAPPDPFNIRAADSALATTTLAELQGLVEAAQAGGGWVPLVFHHVCDGCNEYATPPAVFSALLDWLATQPDVSVRTVRDVIGGPARPVVAPAPLTTGTLQNGELALDRDADGVADCFQHGATGTNEAAWSRSGDTERVTMTRYARGDRKLVTRQDAGLCAPAASAGERFVLAVRVRASAPTRPVAYVRERSGRWRFFAQGPLDAARWRLPRMPAGTSAISVGVSLRGRGAMTVGAVTLTRVAAGPA